MSQGGGVPIDGLSWKT